MVREKSRYVAFKIDFGGAAYRLHPDELLALVRRSVQDLHGDLGLARLDGLKLVAYVSVLSTGIIKTPLLHIGALTSSLFFLSSIRGVPCRVSVLKTSGVLRKLREAVARASAGPGA